MGKEVHVVNTRAESSPSPVRITRSVLDKVVAAAEGSYRTDEEACGYITGPVSDALFCDQAVPLVNLANKYHAVDPETYPRTGRTYFLIDPMKFAKAVKEGAANGRPVKILYHSHLDVGAYFSETDAAAATMGGDAPSYDGLFYLVTSVRGGSVDDHKLFRWDSVQKSFVETQFAIV
jgi:proteasome lid subunit RPN8/RPN11